MDPWKAIAIAMACAFGLALIAWLVARVTRGPLENMASETALDPEVIKILYPQRYFWFHFAMTGLCIALLNNGRSWEAGSRRILPVLALLALIQIIPLLHLRRVASRLPDDHPVQPLLKRRRYGILMVCGFWVLFLVTVFVF